jgi:clan AA aspartic protease
MGLVMTKIRLTNFQDMQLVKAGLLEEKDIRCVEIEALADTGAISLAIPEDVAAQIGAPFLREKTVRVADGRILRVQHVGALYIEVLGREMVGEAIVVPRGTTPLLGAVQMEMLDLVVSRATGEVLPRDPAGPVLPMLAAG